MKLLTKLLAPLPTLRAVSRLRKLFLRSRLLLDGARVPIGLPLADWRLLAMLRDVGAETLRLLQIALQQAELLSVSTILNIAKSLGPLHNANFLLTR